MSSEEVYTLEEVAKHNTKESCWMVLYNKVYDLTNFVNSHPGGATLILINSGKDATVEFEKVGHSQNLLSSVLENSQLIGVLPSSQSLKYEGKLKLEMLKYEKKQSKLPPIEKFLNIYDFTYHAKSMMEYDGWCYYASGSEDEVTLRENQEAFSRIWYV